MQIISGFSYSIPIGKLEKNISVELADFEVNLTPSAYAELFKMGNTLQLDAPIDLVLKNSKEAVLKTSKKSGFAYVKAAAGWKFHNVVLADPYLYCYENEETKLLSGYFYLGNIIIKKSKSANFFELIVSLFC